LNVRDERCPRVKNGKHNCNTCEYLELRGLSNYKATYQAGVAA